MSSLNATRSVPDEWSGNEPDEWAPWEFDSFGSPDQTQRFVRAIADSEYADAPVDEPGNDDLGALSSWYVWAAIGLFPVTPGAADLALASPLFPSVTITLPDGRRLVEDAPGATAARPYVHALTVSGVTDPKPGASACGAAAPPRSPAGTWNLSYISGHGAHEWWDAALHLVEYAGPELGRIAGASPPSFTTEQLPAVGFSMPSGATTLTPGRSTTIHIGIAAAAEGATSVEWQAQPGPGGLTVSPSRGRSLGLVGCRGPVTRPRVPPRHPSRLPSRDGAGHGDGIDPAPIRVAHRGRHHAPARRRRRRREALTFGSTGAPKSAKSPGSAPIRRSATRP